MPTKLQTYSQLAEHTAERLTSSFSNWTGFLATVGRLYKYPYHEQLMIYAQRPDATACADYELWNDKMNRFVRRGSTGIALLDPTGDTPKLKYVFDVSDTGGRENSRRPFLWDMRDYHEQPILEMLEDKFGVYSDNLTDGFHNIANDLAKEYYDNHKEEIPYFAENSFLEDYDEDNLRIAFEDAATVSIAYTLMQRCGLYTESYFEHEDFLPIFDFNTSAAVSLLGTAVSEQSEQVFRQISLTIIKTERERSNEYERNHLQQERGLSDTRHQVERTADTAPREIRQNEENLSGETPQSPVQPPVSDREAASPSTGDRPNRQPQTGAANGRLAENPSTAGQDYTADGVGGTHEQSQSPSGRNDFDGTYLQLTLFPSEQEQIQNIADRQEREHTQSQSAFSISHSEIEYELKHGTGTQGGKLRIYDFYRKYPTEKSAIDFIKNEFGWYGHSHTFSDGTSGFIDYQPSKGMTIDNYDTNSNSTVKWTEIEKYLRALVTTDKYLTTDEKAQYEEHQLATVGMDNVAALPIAEPQPQSALTDTVQTASPEIMTEIIAKDIEAALIDWNDDVDSKARVLSYMQDHSRERGTADWLKNEYGGNLSFFMVEKDGLTQEIPWAKVQRHIGQLVMQNKFFVNDETERYTVEQTSDAWEQPFIIRDNIIPDSDKDRYYHKEDTYLTYDTMELAQATADRLNGTEQQATMELTLEMYDTQSPDIFKVKENSFLVSTELNAPKELWERFAGKGLSPKEDSRHRLIFETDGNNWNRFYIPDTYGNKWNNIEALDVLTSNEIKTMWEVVQKIVPAEERQAVIHPIPYSKGDTVYLENGTPFLIEDITDHQVTLRDPTLFYPVLRAENRDSFLQLLERYPQTKTEQVQAEDFRITDTHLGVGNRREKFQRNIAAITTLQTLERENRPATPKEQETLSQYVGWGGLPQKADHKPIRWLKQAAVQSTVWNSMPLKMLSPMM